MAKKILVSMFTLAILLIGGGAYLIYYGTNQSSEAKDEPKKGYVRNPDLGKRTDFEKENYDKQTPEVQEKLNFINHGYKSYIPDDDTFGSRVDVLKECTFQYLELSKESRQMLSESLGEDSITVPGCAVSEMIEGVELTFDQKDYLGMLTKHFTSYSQQQALYEEQSKEYGIAGPAQRPEIQDELDNIEYRLSYIEDGMTELFNKYFPML